MFLPQSTIDKKAQGKTLTNEEIDLFFSSYLKGLIPDYQCSALLMAIRLKGMDQQECAALTRCMLDSGSRLIWPKDLNPTVDKHSTGGVGDKTSMILAPLCFLEGVRVPMIAGRGLGHTGGTIDKLEAIKGFQTTLPEDQLLYQMKQLGGFIIGQSDGIAPLDRKLYSLRDVTATVKSVPLITASILSKKLSEGLGNLVMDVKVGSGAFMKDLQSAKDLAKSLKEVGALFGLNVRVFITSMDQPLGLYAGNILEILECLDVLEGKGPIDTKELSLTLAKEMVHLAFPSRSLEEIESSMEKNIAQGKALEVFYQLAKAQGADIEWLKKQRKEESCCIKSFVLAKEEGYIETVQVEALGLGVVSLGGGRLQTTDAVDGNVGLKFLKKPGDFVYKAEPMVEVYGKSDKDAAKVAKDLEEAFSFTKTIKSHPNPLILEKI